MKLNIILDDRKPERYGLLLGELIRQRITDYEIYPCHIVPNVVESINLSHKMIVKEAKEKGLKEVCIGEDDLCFPAKDGWDFFLKNKPETYDIYLACSYIPPVNNGIICGFHLYIVAEKFYDKFLSVSDTVHIDTAMNDIDGDYKFCYPFPALQREGFSSNNKAIVNYNSVLDEKSIYKG